VRCLTQNSLLNGFLRTGTRLFNLRQPVSTLSLGYELRAAGASLASSPRLRRGYRHLLMEYASLSPVPFRGAATGSLSA